MSGVSIMIRFAITPTYSALYDHHGNHIVLTEKIMKLKIL
jgi:hypothetical protein